MKYLIIFLSIILIAGIGCNKSSNPSGPKSDDPKVDIIPDVVIIGKNNITIPVEAILEQNNMTAVFHFPDGHALFYEMPSNIYKVFSGDSAKMLVGLPVDIVPSVRITINHTIKQLNIIPSFVYIKDIKCVPDTNKADFQIYLP